MIIKNKCTAMFNRLSQTPPNICNTFLFWFDNPIIVFPHGCVGTLTHVLKFINSSGSGNKKRKNATERYVPYVIIYCLLPNNNYNIMCTAANLVQS